MTRCPDCGNSVELHEMFRDGRCPVVRLDWSIFTNAGTYDCPRLAEALTKPAAALSALPKEDQ